MNQASLNSITNQPLLAPISTLNIAEQNVYQIMDIISRLTSILSDPDPQNAPIVEQLAEQYKTLISSIKTTILVTKNNVGGQDYNPRLSTAHNDQVQADLTSIIVLDAQTALDKMLNEIHHFEA
jgi:electron transfer flavoprotein alpha subunit